MARPSKLEVAAVNIRIPKDRDRDYGALVSEIFALKRGLRVYSDQYLAITEFNEESNVGVLSKYSEIEIDGDWFDVDSFGKAAPDVVENVSIPNNLRPNLSSFDFVLSESSHLFIFEAYSGSKALSPRFVEKYLQTIVKQPNITSRFGFVEVDVVNNIDEVDRILSLPALKELELTIRRPNTDGWPTDLANQVEERLAEQNGRELTEKLVSTADNSLSPNMRTKQLAHVAAENGSVRGKAIVDGLTKKFDSAIRPLRLSESYFSEDSPAKNIFFKLARELVAKVTSIRESLRGGS
jgi:hypothetical protein